MVTIKINTLLVASVLFVSIFGVYESKAMATREQAQERSSFLSILWAGAKEIWNDFDETTKKIAKADAEAVRRQQQKDGERVADFLQAILGYPEEKIESSLPDKGNVSKSAEIQKEKLPPTNQK